jgi:hypothetical protein
MQSKTFRICGENIAEPIIQFVRSFYQKAHESEYPGGLLRVYEDYSLMNGNQIMVCLRLDLTKSEDGMVEIEVIAGGGSGSMLFGEVMGSERRRIRDFSNELHFFCEEMKYRCEVENSN